MTTKKMERETSVIRAPSDGSEVGVCTLANPEDVRAALDANVRVSDACRKMPSHERAAALRRIADGLVAARPEITRTLALEAGKSINQARLELDRTVDVFRTGAEEATRITGEVLTADGVPAGNGKIAITRRFPLSPIAAITPFNYPLLLAAHKLAPALACGAAVTLKPPPQDPLSTLRMFDIIKTSGYPEGGVNVVPCHVEVAQILIEDPRVRMISFTGSARAGWAIRAKAGAKRVALELGGNAAVIVEADADLELAASRCAAGGFNYSGQSCISTQRIFVHQAVYRRFLDLLLPKVKALKVGDVLDEATEIGPVISLEAAERVEKWIDEAKAAGATV
ncbi:MAG TPA: aldehyde dehydrogenase family protein, partial [Gemmatimonadales bacterium]|nr:aldehyde dehydrogenase family protein [Gemmatimonadales bacterium]